MRVALVGDWYLPRLGGIELQVHDLARHLVAAGHTVEVITSVPGPDCIDGVPVHRLGTPRIPGAGIVFTSGAFERLQDLYAAGRYDVVHVQFGIIAPLAYGAAWLAQRAGIPTVATFHSVLRGFDVPLHLVRTAMDVRSWQVTWTAVSSVVAESLRPLLGALPVAVTPNGIDPAWWAQGGRTHGRTSGALRAVSVMRLHRRKRPRFLLESLRDARSRLPAGHSLTLELIGDGPERRRTEWLVESLGLQDAVTLRGWLPRDGVRTALGGADVFLMPSRLEAFGIAALEARCAGLPVVAMQQSGARDFLADGTDALLAGNDEEFTAAVGRLASDPALLARLSEGASAPPSEVGWEVALARLLRAYGAAAYEAESSPAAV